MTPQDRGSTSARVDADECPRERLIGGYTCGGKNDDCSVDLHDFSDGSVGPQLCGRHLPRNLEARGEVRGNEGGDTCVARIPDRPVREPGGTDSQRAHEGDGQGDGEAAEDGRQGLAPRGQRVGESHRALLIGPGAGVRPTMRSPGGEVSASRRLYHGDVSGDMRATMRSS